VTQIISSLGEISGRYQAAYVDLWGCLHNGYRPYPAAVAALRAFRAGGGADGRIVLLLTNSPRPRPSVIRQLEKIGVPRDCWDDIAASGDASQYALAAGDVGDKVYHLGPARDSGFFRDLPQDVLNGRQISRVPLDQAEGIVCTGLFDDETETPEDYRETLLYAKAKGLKMLCTNPDIFVDKGATRIYCAGALGRAYSAMGGQTLYFGKPHPAIYDLARRRLQAIRYVESARILCIGDGIMTDIKGAMGEDLDSLFITGGLAASETGTKPDEAAQPAREKLRAFLKQAVLSPTYAMGHLR